MAVEGAAEVAHEHADEGEGDAGEKGPHHESSQRHLPAAVAREGDADTGRVQRGEVRNENTEADGEDDPETHGHSESG